LTGIVWKIYLYSSPHHPILKTQRNIGNIYLFVCIYGYNTYLLLYQKRKHFLFYIKCCFNISQQCSIYRYNVIHGQTDIMYHKTYNMYYTSILEMYFKAKRTFEKETTKEKKDMCINNNMWIKNVLFTSNPTVNLFIRTCYLFIPILYICACSTIRLWSGHTRQSTLKNFTIDLVWTLCIYLTISI